MQAGALRQKRFKKWIYLKLFEMRNLRCAAAIRYVSELEREQTAHLGLKVPSFMIPTGLDFREFEHLPDRQVARAELAIPEDVLVVGYLGRLDRRKALDVLIRSFARIAQRFPSAILLLAGPDYGEETRLRALAQKLDFNHRVRFLGYVTPEKRTTLLAASNLMTLTGLDGECFGNAAVEAAAAGVPVLMSNNVGVGPTLERDGAGVILLVDEVAIATALERLLGDPALLLEMGQNGYRSARKHFGIRIIAEKMIVAYEDVLAGRRSAECCWA
jgi:glycosyltransferase involved in cell wall biosynthesis